MSSWRIFLFRSVTSSLILCFKGGKYVWSYAGVPFDDLKYHDSS